MGRLAGLARTESLKGPVSVSFADGTQKTFKTEAEAETATAGLELEHRRGAFFEKAAAPITQAAAPLAEAPLKATTKAVKKS